MISRSAARSSRVGLTLVEALIAVAIGAMVIAAFAFAHRSLRRALAVTMEREGRREEALAALAQWAEDLRCAGEDGAGGASALRAEAAPDGSWSLEFVALRAAPDNPDLRYARPRAIAYRLTPRVGGGFELSRSESPTPPRPSDEPPKAVPIARFTYFRAEFLNGENWTDRWPPENGPRWPRAARVEARDRDGAPLAVETWIPCADFFSRELGTAPAARRALSLFRHLRVPASF